MNDSIIDQAVYYSVWDSARNAVGDSVEDYFKIKQ